MMTSEIFVFVRLYSDYQQFKRFLQIIKILKNTIAISVRFTDAVAVFRRRSIVESTITAVAFAEALAAFQRARFSLEGRNQLVFPMLWSLAAARYMFGFCYADKVSSTLRCGVVLVNVALSGDRRRPFVWRPKDLGRSVV